MNETLINQSLDDYNKRFNADTASFEGIDKSGLHWKEIKLHDLFYGYSKVPEANKKIFDEALKSIR